MVLRLSQFKRENSKWKCTYFRGCLHIELFKKNKSPFLEPRYWFSHCIGRSLLSIGIAKLPFNLRLYLDIKAPPIIGVQLLGAAQLLTFE